MYEAIFGKAKNVRDRRATVSHSRDLVYLKHEPQASQLSAGLQPDEQTCLEPSTRSIVGGGRAGRLRQVNISNTGVGDGRVDNEADLQQSNQHQYHYHYNNLKLKARTYLATSGNSSSARSRGSSNIATESSGLDVGDWAVGVVILVLADVLEDTRNLSMPPACMLDPTSTTQRTIHGFS